MTQNQELLEEALSESGIVCFHSVDQPLVSQLCDVIGALHRTLEGAGMTAAAISEAVAAELA
jgi:hypothetical protein